MARRTARKSTMPPPARPLADLANGSAARSAKRQGGTAPALRPRPSRAADEPSHPVSCAAAPARPPSGDNGGRNGRRPIAVLTTSRSRPSRRHPRAVVAVHGRGRLASSGIVWEPGLVVTAEETVERDTDLALTLARRAPRRSDACGTRPLDRHRRAAFRRRSAGGRRDGRVRSAAGPSRRRGRAIAG